MNQNQNRGDPSGRDGNIHVFGGETKNVTDKNRFYTFGLLGLISAVLMSRMGVTLIKPPQMSHTCGTSKPCQSAQTSELANSLP